MLLFSDLSRDPVGLKLGTTSAARCWEYSSAAMRDSALGAGVRATWIQLQTPGPTLGRASIPAAPGGSATMSDANSKPARYTLSNPWDIAPECAGAVWVGIRRPFPRWSSASCVPARPSAWHRCAHPRQARIQTTGSDRRLDLGRPPGADVAGQRTGFTGRTAAAHGKDCGRERSLEKGSACDLERAEILQRLCERHFVLSLPKCDQELTGILRDSASFRGRPEEIHPWLTPRPKDAD